MTPGRAGSKRVSRFTTLLDAATDETFVTTSDAADLAALVEAVDGWSADGSVRVLTDDDTVRELRRTFLLSSQVADLTESGVVEARAESTDDPLSSLVVTDDRVSTLVGVSTDVVAAMNTEATPFVDEVRQELQRRWERAESLSLRAPPYSRMLETLEDELGAAVRTDVERLLETTSASQRTEMMDPVQVSLLVGAKNEVQFYELGRWGETTGLASRAKFSREKQTLEEAGLIDTEKIPRDIGRPRQRLVPGETLEHSKASEIVEAAERALFE